MEQSYGYWEDGCGCDNTGRVIYHSIDCSECNEIFKIESHNSEYWKERFKYCPFCGTPMINVSID